MLTQPSHLQSQWNWAPDLWKLTPFQVLISIVSLILVLDGLPPCQGQGWNPAGRPYPAPLFAKKSILRQTPYSTPTQYGMQGPLTVLVNSYIVPAMSHAQRAREERGKAASMWNAVSGSESTPCLLHWTSDLKEPTPSLSPHLTTPERGWCVDTTVAGCLRQTQGGRCSPSKPMVSDHAVQVCSSRLGAIHLLSSACSPFHD
jgi:hypothetical protein